MAGAARKFSARRRWLAGIVLAIAPSRRRCFYERLAALWGQRFDEGFVRAPLWYDMEMAPLPQEDDAYVDQVLLRSESMTFDCKRTGKIDKLLETVIAFANTEGGTIAIGVEDPDKAVGRERVFGTQLHPNNWDEIQRSLRSRITEPDQLAWSHQEVGCTLRDGNHGTIILLKIAKSRRVHSIVDNGTFTRLTKGNKHLTSSEINDLCHARGVISAESQVEDIDFEILNTDYWRAYADKRKLTRPIGQAMFHIGLARRDSAGNLRPNRAAVLLFAEEPTGVLGGKTAVRIFHYKGSEISTDPNTNLTRPPINIVGPLVRQILDARQAVVNELAGRVQFGPLGFEIVQRYPVRVIAEAITNAVIHRDYRLNSDIIVRIFSDRIEIESPGLLVGPVTVANIGRIGAHSRNPLIIQHLREFPNPPNLDAGEGV
ncbi:MAG TPA: RNA-binding domain-containing protein, partial [Humisphaera sp.]|nr:RNA-binding domain-containing protein [Humisphaera sp.]